MDAKLRDDLFRRYAAFLETRLEEGVSGRVQGDTREEALVSTATTLLGACEADAGQQFRTIRFYDIVENSLRTLRGSNLHALESAFATLETICTNLLLFPWKKEFRCIKTFTGPYIYQLQSSVCDSDLRSVLRSMGYSRDLQDLQYLIRDQHAVAGAHHLRQLAFELLLAQAECRLLRERGGGVAELEAVEVRRNSGDDVTRLSARTSDPDRIHLRRTGRPSKSVDVTDSAGHWHHATNKPVLKTSLSLRKEPLFVDAPEEEPKDEIIRPGGDYYPSQPSESYPYHLSSLDEIDLYTERGTSGRHTPSSRESWESWAPKSHGLKCQGCSMTSPTLSSCQRCDAILCPTCHGSDPAPCCGFPDFPKIRPLDGWTVKDKLSVYSSSHPHTHTHPLSHTHSHSPLLDKPISGAKLFTSKTQTAGTTAVAMTAAPGTGGGGGSRCGFCNKPGASHTCINCSKVSCDPCTGLYMGDVCTRKSLHHHFIPNHQLNYKHSTVSHLVYR